MIHQLQTQASSFHYYYQLRFTVAGSVYIAKGLVTCCDATWTTTYDVRVRSSVYFRATFYVICLCFGHLLESIIIHFSANCLKRQGSRLSFIVDGDNSRNPYPHGADVSSRFIIFFKSLAIRREWGLSWARTLIRERSPISNLQVKFVTRSDRI